MYPKIVRGLRISKEKDTQSRDTLFSILAKKRGGKDARSRGFSSPLDLLIERFGRRRVRIIVFGAGPSLEEDIKRLYPVARGNRNLIVAADGAADALLSAMIVPDILVTDLDSCSEDVLKSQSEKRALVVHAHGDNTERLQDLVPNFGCEVLGSTQVEPLGNIANYGGFTDGDRACYLSALFEPKMVALAGMSFGSEEGPYSKSRLSIKENFARKTEEEIDSRVGTIDDRQRKLEYGKESLEMLIETSRRVRFLNATSKGEVIRGAESPPLRSIIEALS